MQSTSMSILAASLLASCVQQPGSPQPHPPRAGMCDPARTGYSVGKPYSTQLAEQARKIAGAEQVRRIAPGQVVTLEHLGTRLTLSVDERNVVKQADCG